MVKAINQAEFKDVCASGVCVVDFYADWCGPCKMMAPVLDEISEEMSDVSFYKINVDENQDIAAENGIMSIPAIGLFKDGVRINMSVGYVEKEELVDFINNNK